MQFVQTKSIGSTPMLYGADSFLILSVTTVFSYFLHALDIRFLPFLVDFVPAIKHLSLIHI